MYLSFYFCFFLLITNCFIPIFKCSEIKSYLPNFLEIISITIALSVGLGFIISQLYYGISRLLNIDIISKYKKSFQVIIPEVKDYCVNLIDPIDSTELDLINFSKNHEIYFGYLYSYLRDNLKKDDPNLKRENELSDLSHSIGASSYAVVLSLIVYLFFTFYKTSFMPFSFHLFYIYNLFSMAIFFNIIITILIVLILVKNRSDVALHQIIILEQLVGKIKKDKTKYKTVKV